MFNKVRLYILTENGLSTLQIVGRNRFLIDLFANSLLHEASAHCQVFRDDTDMPVDSTDPTSYSINLVDGHNLVLEEHWGEVLSCCEDSASQCHYALFNVDQKANFPVEAMRKGVRGIFYINDSLEMVCKGIRKLVEGDVWFSRDTLLNCVLQQFHQSDSIRTDSIDTQIKLTFREKEILNHLSQGATNQEIADEMIVSVHTVKSHLYNLYKKINVPNRFQAMIWAASKQVLGIIIAIGVVAPELLIIPV